MSAELYRAAQDVLAFMEQLGDLDLTDSAADGGVTVGMVVQQQARQVYAPRLRAAIKGRDLSVHEVADAWARGDIQRVSGDPVACTLLREGETGTALVRVNGRRIKIVEERKGEFVRGYARERVKFSYSVPVRAAQPWVKDGRT